MNTTEISHNAECQFVHSLHVAQRKEYWKLKEQAIDAATAELSRECDELREAIKQHRNQKADDRCIEDDDRLYAALGDGIPCDRRVGDKAAMIWNCQRFIQRRCEGGGWPSYAELERQIGELRDILLETRQYSIGPKVPNEWFIKRDKALR